MADAPRRPHSLRKYWGKRWRVNLKQWSLTLKANLFNLVWSQKINKGEHGDPSQSHTEGFYPEKQNTVLGNRER